MIPYHIGLARWVIHLANSCSNHPRNWYVPSSITSTKGCEPVELLVWVKDGTRLCLLWEEVTKDNGKPCLHSWYERDSEMLRRPFQVFLPLMDFANLQMVSFGFCFARKRKRERERVVDLPACVRVYIFNSFNPLPAPTCPWTSRKTPILTYPTPYDFALIFLWSTTDFGASFLRMSLLLACAWMSVKKMMLDNFVLFFNFIASDQPFRS